MTGVVASRDGALPLAVILFHRHVPRPSGANCLHGLTMTVEPPVPWRAIVDVGEVEGRVLDASIPGAPSARVGWTVRDWRA